jgi:uncharacterized RDD family membrane protein YckC
LKRFAGAFVDNLALLISTIVVAIVLQVLGFRNPLALVLIAWTLCVAVNGFLLQRGGQTVGKVVAGTRIVDKNGNKPGLVLLLLRYFIQQAPAFVVFLSTAASLIGIWLVLRMRVVSLLQPLILLLAAARLVGAVFSLTDTLFIFGRSRRCLHDFLLGTRVIDD